MEPMTAFAAASLACSLTARAVGLAFPPVDADTPTERSSWVQYKDGSACRVVDTVDERRVVFVTADNQYLTGVMQKYPEGYKGKKDPLYPTGYKKPTNRPSSR